MPASQRLSILHVLAPARFGGLESVVRDLAIGQARRGNRIRVAALSASDSDEPHSVVASLQHTRVEPVEWRTDRRAYVAQILLVAKACRSWKPDIVHTHGYHADVIAGIAARWVGVPVVTTVHGFVGGGWKNLVYERLQRWAFRGFDAVVPVSRSLARELADEGGLFDRIHPIPNAWAEHDEPVGRDDARAVLGLKKDANVIGWVGRLSREKGLDVLLDALARVKYDSWRLAVVGEGPEAQMCRSRAEALGLEERVSWLGAVEDAGRYFRAFDIFCLSSRTEGMPVVLFEAMAAGVPVVATRVGGVEEVLNDDNAWLCSPEDPGALCARLTAALEDRDASRRKAAKAGDRLREDFAPDTWLDRYEALYRDLTRSGREAAT